MRFFCLVSICVCFTFIGQAQFYSKCKPVGHSHNDYFQNQPFQTAFQTGMGSIEADVFLWNDNLFVAHTFFEIDETCTFDALYLQPIVFAVRSGKAYPLQLMLDIKTRAGATLHKITQELARYPDVFNEKSLIKIIISGNRPTPSVWNAYPAFIQFDGRPDENYTPEQWQRVGLVSDNFNSYKSWWWGNPDLCANTCERLKKALDFVHSKGKKMRFWKTPDNKVAWEVLTNLGVDFINTDTPSALKSFFENKTNEAVFSSK